MKAPAVSVLMPVYNGAEHLGEAIASIRAQSFEDFELLVVDDGSTDASPEMLRACPDPRLRVLRNDRNLGLIASLNRGLEEARGEYVARMDADDTALPRRLERQRELLVGSPRIGLCGTWFRMLDGAAAGVVRSLVRPEDLAAKLFYESPLAHPSVMFRRTFFANHGLRYDAEFPHAEDFELWTRVAQVTKLANVPEVLLLYRQHGGQVSARHERVQAESVKKIVLRQLRRIHPDATESECEAHAAIVRNRKAEAPEVGYVEAWLGNLIRRNEATSAGFPPSAFRRAIAILWWRYCSARSAQSGILSAFYTSPLTRSLPLKNRLGMLIVRAGAALGTR
ncbi:MAG: glycosyltransferase family 2 protein [Burkholderiales bacterium]